MKLANRMAFATLATMTLASWSCGDSAAPAAPAAPRLGTLYGVTLDSAGIGARLRLTASEPLQVRIRYWSRDVATDTLTETFSLIQGSSTAVLTRLVPGSTYAFDAVVTDGLGHTGPPIAGTFATPSLPADLAALRVAPSGAPSEPVMMIEPRVASGFNGFVAADERGNVVWFYRTVGPAQGIVRRANGNFVLNDLGNGLREVTPNGELVHSLDYNFFGPSPHHDLVETPSGGILFISHDLQTPPGRATIFGEAIYEWVPETGVVTKRWSAWDWYDPAVDWGERSYDQDWLHANSLALGPHGNIVLSLNWIDQVISIAPDWSHLEWRLGGRNGAFAMDSTAVFSGQHSVTMPTEGHVLMFDNERESTAPRPVSRALELALDSVAHRATLAWQFESPAGNYAPYLGLARRLPNGNTFVFFGLPTGPFNDKTATGPVSGFEVTPAGKVVFEDVVTGVRSVYREWLLPRLGTER